MLQYLLIILLALFSGLNSMKYRPVWAEKTLFSSETGWRLLVFKWNQMPPPYTFFFSLPCPLSFPSSNSSSAFLPPHLSLPLKHPMDVLSPLIQKQSQLFFPHKHTNCHRKISLQERTMTSWYKHTHTNNQTAIWPLALSTPTQLIINILESSLPHNTIIRHENILKLVISFSKTCRTSQHSLACLFIISTLIQIKYRLYLL